MNGRSRFIVARLGRNSGFTLVELLVVIAIIGMLMALLVPAVQRAREAGRRTTCINNQHQISAAILNFVTAKDRFPSGFSPHPASVPGGTGYVLGWVPPMLPYLEQKPLYDQIQANPTLTSLLVVNGVPITPEISLLICPTRSSTDTPAPLSYAVNAGWPDGYATPSPSLDFQANGVFFDHYSITYPGNKGGRITTDLAYMTRNDGTTNTVMFSENIDAKDWIGQAGTGGLFAPALMTPTQGATWWQGIIWYVNTGAGASWNPTDFLNRFTEQPTLDDLTSGKPSSSHPSGFVMTMCDGHSVFVSEDIEYRVYAMMMAPESAKAMSTLNNMFVAYPDSWKLAPPAPDLRPVTEADLTK